MFRKLSLNRLLETAGKKIGESKVADGYIGGHAKLSGQGKSLHQILGSSTGAVGIGMQGGDISNLIVELIGLDVAQGLGFFFGGDKTTGIRCIIGDFGVTDGMMKSNALVIDTNDTNIQGDGTINLKNEALNLRLKAKPKDTSFASLRTPFDIQGTMKHPDVSLEKKDLVEKGAAAVAIGVVLTPIASILGFVDPSHGKDSDCGKLYDEMKAHTSTSDASSHVPVNATQQDKPLPKDQ